jgi:hypothetical protein
MILERGVEPRDHARLEINGHRPRHLGLKQHGQKKSQEQKSGKHDGKAIAKSARILPQSLSTHPDRTL